MADTRIARMENLYTVTITVTWAYEHRDQHTYADTNPSLYTC